MSVLSKPIREHDETIQVTAYSTARNDNEELDAILEAALNEMPIETKEQDKGETDEEMAQFAMALQRQFGGKAQLLMVDTGKGLPPGVKGISMDEMARLFGAEPLETVQKEGTPVDLLGKMQEMMNVEKMAFNAMVSLCQDSLAVTRLLLKGVICPVPVRAVGMIMGNGVTLLGIPGEGLVEELLGFEKDDTRSIKVLKKEELQAYLEKHFSQLMNPSQLPLFLGSMMAKGYEAMEEFMGQFKGLPQRLAEQGMITFISKGEADAEVTGLLPPITRVDAPFPRNQQTLEFLKIPTDHPYYETMVHDPDFGIEYDLACLHRCTSPELRETFYTASQHIRTQMERKEGLSDAEKYANYGMLLKLMTGHHFGKGADQFIEDVQGALLTQYAQRIGF